MRNIILQHYDGKLGELEKFSVDNIKRYAERCGAEYELVLGKPLGSKLCPQSQKLCMLLEKYDDYDMVVMLDIDMFERKGQTANIFTDATGIGMYSSIQQELHKGLVKTFPMLCGMDAPYWGGAVYRMNLEERKRLRKVMDVNELAVFNRSHVDEGCMNRLSFLSGQKFSTLSGPDGGAEWCHCSFKEGIENAALIHIRPKFKLTGPRVPKIDVYQNLVSRGLVE